MTHPIKIPPVVCQAGHKTHATRKVTIVLSGQSTVHEYPAIPERWRRTFWFTIFNYDQYMGFHGYCPGQDEMSLSLVVNGIWEGYETIVAMDILSQRAPGVVIDIGAHIGWYTLLAASFGYPVVAIEANEENIRVLKRNIERNKGLLYEKTSEFRFMLNYTNPPPIIQQRWIDEGEPQAPESIGPIRFLKVDIEGKENHAIRMFQYHWVNKLIDFALIEITPDFTSRMGYNIEDEIRRIIDCGYYVYDIPDKSCTRKAEFETDPLAALAHYRITDVPRYLKDVQQANFLFSSEEL